MMCLRGSKDITRLNGKSCAQQGSTEKATTLNHIRQYNYIIMFKYIHVSHKLYSVLPRK